MKQHKWVIPILIVLIKAYRKDKKLSVSKIRDCCAKRDKEKYEIVAEELKQFEKLIAGHRKLLTAIGNL